ncbi:MAG: Hsp70 family protein [Deltaproteobacteria bacterium]|nr:Hsp70 family protein [Deltaproteobacteria bacterium]
MAIYGIDLGTTFCSVAYVDRGVARCVPLERARSTLASLVLLTTRAGPRAVAGAEALAVWRELVGEAEHAPEDVVLVRGSKNHLAVGRGVLHGPPWRLGDRELNATDVGALLLRALGEYVRHRPSLPALDAVVLAHPQRFRNREKLATAQAARLAGLPVAGLVTEPDAAAWAYGLHAPEKGACTFMVYDFGGGTLDVTILRREPGGARVQLRALASYGIQLGGLDLDRRIRDQLVLRYAELTRDPAFSLALVNEATRERLLELAEGIKIALNTDASADPSPLERMRRKRFTPVFDAASEGEEVTFEVSLGELSRWLGGELTRALACADEALSRASLGWKDLDEVLLTGGSSLLFPLQQRMKERCARVRVFDDPEHPLNPLTIVAAGAAIHGAHLADAGSVGVDLRGVVPDAFCIRAWHPAPETPEGRRAVLAPLVPAGTPTPYVGTRSFAMRGGGRVLPITVYEGASEHEATPVGTFRLEFGQDIPDGARVDVRLDVRANGVLLLGVTDQGSREVREARLDDAPGLYAETELDARARWLQALPLEWRP